MSTGVDVYSTTAASNGTIGGTGYFPEGQAPSTVNDAARQVMADIAAWYGQAKTPEYLTGVSGTNTVTAGGPASLAAYGTGQRFVFIPANKNTGATTINITPSGGAALGAKNVFASGAACVGGELQASQPVEIVYDGTQFNILGRTKQPTRQVLTSGTGATYTTPAGASRIYVRLVGSGGGGAGGGAGATGGAAGTDTTFSTLTGTKGGGGGPGAVQNPGIGAAGTGGDLNLTGADGGGGSAVANTSGAHGGSSPFGGAGGMSVATAAGNAAKANTGSGGGGGGNVGGNSGGGGGAGGYVEKLITAPAATYTYTVGAAGTAGAGGGGGGNGAAGGTGLIIVDEYYD